MDNDICSGCALRAAEGREIGRRGFLSAGLLATASLLLSACSTDATGPASSSGGSFTIEVARYSQLQTAGGIAVVTAPNGFPAAVVRTGDGFVALSRVCPHQGVTIQQTAAGFRCPGHGATFTATGGWSGGERTSNMRTLALSYDAAAGTVTIG